jgi:hypothetical protein
VHGAHAPRAATTAPHCLPGFRPNSFSRDGVVIEVVLMHLLLDAKGKRIMRKAAHPEALTTRQCRTSFNPSTARIVKTTVAATHAT